MVVTGGVMFACAVSLRRFYETGMTQLDLRTEAAQALARMVAELQNATRTAPGGGPPNLSIPAPPANDRLQFHLPKDLDGNGVIVNGQGAIEWDQGTPIQYQYVPGQRQLRRLEGGNQVVLANDVASVAFTDQSIDGTLFVDEVRIQLTLQRSTPHGRTISATASGAAKLRN